VVLLMTLAVFPALNRLFAVTVAKQTEEIITPASVPDKPEQVPVTVYFIMEENTKKISSVYVEVFQIETETVYYLEIPEDTRVDLSEELYKSLQTYGPELPQHLKIANMVESFSAEYGLTAGVRILSEVLGISLKEYVRTPAEPFDNWLKLQQEEKASSGFFEAYSQWLCSTTSSRTLEERWSYYESRLQITDAVMETAPGSREKDGYRISSKRTRERLEEFMRGMEKMTETEE